MVTGQVVTNAWQLVGATPGQVVTTEGQMVGPPGQVVTTLADAAMQEVGTTGKIVGCTT